MRQRVGRDRRLPRGRRRNQSPVWSLPSLSPRAASPALRDEPPSRPARTRDPTQSPSGGDARAADTEREELGLRASRRQWTTLCSGMLQVEKTTQDILVYTPQYRFTK